jgi:hypothetical protein
MRVGNVYWNSSTRCYVVVYGRPLQDGKWRVVNVHPGPMTPLRYGRWTRVPDHCTLVKEP